MQDDAWFWEARPREERQAQSQAVDMAERLARMFGPEDDGIDTDQVASFLSRALWESGYERPIPRIAIDLDDDDALIELLEPGAIELLQGDYQLHSLVKDGLMRERQGKFTKLQGRKPTRNLKLTLPVKERSWDRR